jgi:hypothetical protein
MTSFTVPSDGDVPGNGPDSGPDSGAGEEPQVEHGELVVPGERLPKPAQDQEGPSEMVSEPAKVMRIGSMVKQLLDEVKAAPLDEASRERLAAIHERSVIELAQALSPDLQDELRSLALPFQDGVPSEAELRIAQAQLVGWLEGLFHGIQATLFAQQLAARQQLEQMRQLPAGQQTMPGGPPRRRTPPARTCKRGSRRRAWSPRIQVAARSSA